MSSNTSKYFSFPNSSINTFKESFNKFLSDIKSTSLYNVISNPDFKQYYGGKPFNWVETVPSGSIYYDISNPNSIINFTQPLQQVSQNIASELKPNVEYAVSFEFESTGAVEFSINYSGTGLINLFDNNSTTLILQSYASAQERTKGFIYFKTPALIANSLQFIIKNTSNTSNNITIYSLTCQQGMVEFFDVIAKDFWNESVKYENLFWRLTNDGIHYQKILRDGDILPILVDEALKDEINNVYYTVNINNKTIYLKTANIIVDDYLYIVDDNFVDAYSGYITQHINSEDLFDGLHAIPDIITNKKYDIEVNGDGTPVLVENIGTSTNGLGAERFYVSFNVEHSLGGEHVFKSTSGLYDKSILLSVNESNGVGTLMSADYTKVSIPVMSDHTYIGNYYFDSTKNMFHDEDGNHIIKDTLGRMWYFYASNGSPLFKSKHNENVVTDSIFNSFRLEHDIHGRHVLRDQGNGLFYKLIVENGNLSAIRCNMHTISTKQELLSAYQFEHDINGNHILQDIITNKYYKIIVQNEILSLQEVDSVIREFHHDNIATSKFEIEHNVVIDNSIFSSHSFVDISTSLSYTIKMINSQFYLEEI